MATCSVCGYSANTHVWNGWVCPLCKKSPPKFKQTGMAFSTARSAWVLGFSFTFPIQTMQKAINSMNENINADMSDERMPMVIGIQTYTYTEMQDKNRELGYEFYPNNLRIIVILETVFDHTNAPPDLVQLGYGIIEME